MRLVVEGAPAHPRGSMLLQVQEVSFYGMPPLQASLAAQLDGQLRARLAVAQGGQPLLEARAALALPTGTLLQLPCLLRAPFAHAVDIWPLTVPRSDPQVGDGGVNGKLRIGLGGRLVARGSLLDPRLRLEAWARWTSPHEAELGEAQLVGSYRRQRAELALSLSSSPSGRLGLTGSLAGLDLSLPALLRGISWDRLPLQAKLRSERFELASFSGLSEALPTIAGRVDGQVALSGSWRRPRLRGSVQWQGGRLRPSGLDELYDLLLRLRFDEKRILLEQLSFRAGEGRVQLSGRWSFLADFSDARTGLFDLLWSSHF